MIKAEQRAQQPQPGSTIPSVFEALGEKIRSRSARVGVIGLGYVGLPLGCEFARHGFHVTGVDLDAKKIEAIRGGKSYIADVASEEVDRLVSTNRLVASADYSLLAELDTVDICVPTPLRKTKDPDLSHILAAVEEIQKYLHP